MTMTEQMIATLEKAALLKDDMEILVDLESYDHLPRRWFLVARGSVRMARELLELIEKERATAPPSHDDAGG